MSDRFPDFRFTATKVEVFGTKGVMYFGRQGGGWMVYDDTWNVVASEYGRETTDEHLRNFFDCIVSRDKPNCDIEEAHLDIIICHLANISYRLGNRKLRFDGATERFIGDDEANALLKREYRAPWIIPEDV